MNNSPLTKRLDCAVVPTIDFETYSDAGYMFDHVAGRWRPITPSPPHGLGAVGAWKYAEHPSTDIICIAIYWHDDQPPEVWIPGLPEPARLFEHVRAGGKVRAWNGADFEFPIWNGPAVKKHGFPPLKMEQIVDDMIVGRAFGLPGFLAKAAAVLGTFEKDPKGKQLIRTYSMPRSPTKGDASLRNLPVSPEMYEYCAKDTLAEASVADACPPLPEWVRTLHDVSNRINERGVYIDPEGLALCIEAVNLATNKGNAEMQRMIGCNVTEIGKIAKWVAARGVNVPKTAKGNPSLSAENLETLLLDPILPPDVRHVLQLREELGGANVKKLFSIQRRLTNDQRLHGLFSLLGAERTGRFAGRGPQPQNLSASLPPGYDEDNPDHDGQIERFLATAKDHEDPIAVVTGCLRALFTAAPGKVLLCSDYSAIEAVVAAMLSGEQWRINVFNTHGKIYEMSASKITGTPFEEMLAHKERTGKHHPLRKSIGKIAELASGYGGWINAWKAFGADAHFVDDNAIKDAVLKWRAESPAIVEMWGGQYRNRYTPELYGIEGAVIQAISNPDTPYKVGEFLTYWVDSVRNVLFCQLPSGRCLVYQQPQLEDTQCKYTGQPKKRITFMGKDYRGNYSRVETYGGRLFENACQAVAFDILAHALIQLEAAGYPAVLHVHDEIASEIDELDLVFGGKSIEEFERIMSTMPAWAHNWPIRAIGGFTGKRYRK